MFCALSQNYRHLFWKMIYASYSKLSKEFKNSLKIYIGRSRGCWLIDLNNILTIFIHNFKTVWPTKISMPIYYKMHMLFFKVFGERAQNMLIWVRRCSTFLTDQHFSFIWLGQYKKIYIKYISQSFNFFLYIKWYQGFKGHWTIF